MKIRLLSHNLGSAILAQRPCETDCHNRADILMIFRRGGGAEDHNGESAARSSLKIVKVINSIVQPFALRSVCVILAQGPC